jgi:hypothetical protein
VVQSIVEIGASQRWDMSIICINLRCFWWNPEAGRFTNHTIAYSSNLAKRRWNGEIGLGKHTWEYCHARIKVLLLQGTLRDYAWLACVLHEAGK